MRSTLSKMLFQLSRRDRSQSKGFTLIELLVVIIIIGILAAIALPSFLNQASKARQAEAKTALGALMRGQQTFRLENQRFAMNVAELGIGQRTETQNYLFLPEEGAPDTDQGDFSDPVSPGGDFTDYAEIYADAVDDDAVRDYIAGVAASADQAGNATTVTIVCESNRPVDQTDGLLPDIVINSVIPTGGTVAVDIPECANGGIELGGVVTP